MNKQRRQYTENSEAIDQDSILKAFLNFDINEHRASTNTSSSSKQLNLNTLGKRNKSEHHSLDSFESIHRNSSNSCSNLHRKVSMMSHTHDTSRGSENARRRNTLFKNPVVQMIKHLTVKSDKHRFTGILKKPVVSIYELFLKSTDEVSSDRKGSFTAPGTPFTSRTSHSTHLPKQSEEMRNRVLSEFNSEDLYKGKKPEF